MNGVLLAFLISLGVALLVVLAVAGFVAWKVWRSDERALARRMAKLGFRDKLSLGRDLLTDERVPVVARIVGFALILYLASPIDLLPDFIPVIGWLDDILIVMAGAGLLLRSVPRYVIEEHLSRYEDRRDGRTIEGPAPRPLP